MDWNRMGAIGSLGSFLISGIIFAVQVWPLPSLRSRVRGTAARPPEGSSATNDLHSAEFRPAPIAAFLIIGFLLSGLSIWGAWHPQVVAITPDNVETFVKTWVDDIGYADTRLVSKQELPPDYYFAVEAKFVRSPFGDAVEIGRIQSHPNYLVITSDLDVSPPELNELSKLSAEENLEIERSIEIQLNRIQMPYDFVPIQKLHLEKHIPIEGLTEDRILAGIEAVHSAQQLAREVILLDIQLTKQHEAPMQ